MEMALRPSVNFRAQELPVSEPVGGPYEFRAVGAGFEIALKDSGLPPLRLKLCSTDATFTLKGKRIENILYPTEESRGYQARGDLWSPGYFRFVLQPGRRAALVASTESSATMNVLQPDQALTADRQRRQGLSAEAASAARHDAETQLVLAVDSAM